MKVDTPWLFWYPYTVTLSFTIWGLVMSMDSSFGFFDFRGFPIHACSVKSEINSDEEFEVFESKSFKGFTIHVFSDLGGAKSGLIKTWLSPYIMVDRKSGRTYLQWGGRKSSDVHDHHTDGYYGDTDKIVAYFEGSTLPYKKRPFPFSECTTRIKDRRNLVFYQSDQRYWVANKDGWIYLCYPYVMESDEKGGLWLSVETGETFEHKDEVVFFVKDK